LWRKRLTSFEPLYHQWQGFPTSANAGVTMNHIGMLDKMEFASRVMQLGKTSTAALQLPCSRGSSPWQPVAALIPTLLRRNHLATRQPMADEMWNPSVSMAWPIAALKPLMQAKK
jgi:hypothetical protein